MYHIMFSVLQSLCYLNKPYFISSCYCIQLIVYWNWRKLFKYYTYVFLKIWIDKVMAVGKNMFTFCISCIISDEIILWQGCRYEQPFEVRFWCKCSLSYVVRWSIFLAKSMYGWLLYIRLIDFTQLFVFNVYCMSCKNA